MIFSASRIVTGRAVAKSIDAAVETAAHRGEGDLRRLNLSRRRSAWL